MTRHHPVNVSSCDFLNAVFLAYLTPGTLCGVDRLSQCEAGVTSEFRGASGLSGLGFGESVTLGSLPAGAPLPPVLFKGPLYVYPGLQGAVFLVLG